MNIALRYAARSDVGLVRANNQDAAYAGPHLLVVADGMGGHAGGDVASSMTIAALAHLDGESHGPDDALSELERSVDEARVDLVQRSEEEPDLNGMGTTVTAMLRAGNKLVMAHLGDSRAYLLRDGELAQVTTDHTFVQHLVDSGRITAEEAESHPQRNVVMRVLGDFDVDLTPDMSVREARAGDRWLLCSDGLSGFVSIETLEQTLIEMPDIDECADHLVQLALRAGSTDNITAVVADVVDLDRLPDGAGPGTTAQVVGSAAKDHNRATVAQDGPAARAAALPELSAEGDLGDASDARDTPRRRRWVPVLATLLILGGLAAAAWAAYAWTQTQYYVGVSDDKVAVFQGIPTSIGSFELSTAVDVTDTAVSDLPDYLQTRVEQTVPAKSLADAEDRAAGIADNAIPPTVEVEPSPTETPTTGDA
ncbi:Stp1/IreP family PP2C-type Ser/Thr phosphatase, partial [Paraoerskovia marina]|uniref:Stp1/IreP family PP2C-type Ser/Thr phosphatase n=1 Tax=Paraoerskovia marina TaxID=545619 RepID=UPI000492B763